MPPSWLCYRNAARYRLFLDLLDFVPHSPIQACLWHNIGLRFANNSYIAPKVSLSSTKLFVFDLNSCFQGVNVTVPDFGGVQSIRFLDTSATSGGRVPIWNLLLSLLAKRGYVPGLDVRAAPYDWRKGRLSIFLFCLSVFVFVICVVYCIVCFLFIDHSS